MTQELEIIVCKFGGSGNATKAQIDQQFEIIQADPRRRLIVDSAPGIPPGATDFPYNEKITDMLIALARSFRGMGELDEALFTGILQRYDAIIQSYQQDGLQTNPFEDFRQQLEERTRYFTQTMSAEQHEDNVKRSGEEFHSQLMTFIAKEVFGLNAIYFDPQGTNIIRPPFTKGRFDYTRTMANIKANLAQQLVDDPTLIVFTPGFYGFTPDGIPITTDRGGSDTTAGVYAGAFAKSGLFPNVLYENWTDQSMRVTDPNFWPAAAGLPPIPEITYPELRELRFGILYPDALHPCQITDTEIHLRDWKDPSNPGTKILPRRNIETHELGCPIGVNGETYYRSMIVSMEDMARAGIGHAITSTLMNLGIPYESMPASADSIRVIIEESYLTKYGDEIEAGIRERLKESANGSAGEITPQIFEPDHKLGVLRIAGYGVRSNKVSVLSRTLTALERVGIEDFETIESGGADYVMTLGLHIHDLKPAVTAVCEEFYG